jgi:hypothetical protein
MKRVGPPWARGDVLAITLLVGLLVFALVGALILKDQPANTNYGFGPDWDCKPVPYGAPVCVKKR